VDLAASIAMRSSPGIFVAIALHGHTHPSPSDMSPDPVLTPTRRALFWLILALVVLSPALLGEAAVRLGGLDIPDDPYLHFGRVSSFFTRERRDGVDVMRVANRSVYRERRTQFLAHKPDSVFRVFCLGSSASAGWPHPAAEIYSQYLQDALRAAYPGHAIEVVNVSAHAYPLYRTRLIFREILRYQPDLIVLYGGNNEFVEQRRYRDDGLLPAIERVANHSVLYRLLRGGRIGRTLWPDNTLEASQRTDPASVGYSKIAREPLDLVRDTAQLARVNRHVGFSVRDILGEASRRGIPAIVLTVPVNLRDWFPHVSVADGLGNQREAFRADVLAGKQALATGHPDSAVAALRRAAALAPRHAATQFHLARALEALGQDAEARAAYSRARDADHNPFRAMSSFNDSIRTIARELPGVTLVDAARLFDSAAAPHAPGFDLFLDYVHPTRRGNLLLARAVYAAIVQRRLVGPAAVPPFDSLAGCLPFAHSAYTDEADVAMQMQVSSLSIAMHQYARSRVLGENVRARATPADSIPAAQWERLALLIARTPALDAAERATVEGMLDRPEDRDVRRQLRAFYEALFPGYRTYRRPAGLGPGDAEPDATP
jgi:tetratricopeptide (TPR) repeat protein